MNQFQIVASPAVEPVTVEEVKNYLRLTSSLEDVMIGALIVAARSWVENITRRALITQSLGLILDAWPEAETGGACSVLLPCPPLISVTRVTLYDENNISSEWAASNYWVDGVEAQGRLVLQESATFPTLRKVGALRIDYTAGYGSTGSAVPEMLRTAIKQLVAFWYEHRGDAVNGSDAAAVPASVLALVAPYRVMRMG